MHPLAVGYKYPITQFVDKTQTLQYSPEPYTRTPKRRCNIYVFSRSSFVRLSVISGNPPPIPNVLLPSPFR